MMKWILLFLSVGVCVDALAEQSLGHNSGLSRDIGILSENRQNHRTNASVLGYLIKEGNSYQMIDNIQNRGAVGRRVDVNPALKIDPSLLNQKVRVTWLYEVSNHAYV